MARSIAVATTVGQRIENFARSLLRSRAISLSTMSPRLRYLSLGVMSLLLVSGILLAAPALPGPTLMTDKSPGGVTQISLVIYLFTLAVFALGWTLATMATFGLPTGPRLLLLAPVIWLLGSAAASRLLAVGGHHGLPTAEFWLRLLQLAAIAALMVFAVASALLDGNRAAGDEQSRLQSAATRVRWLVPVLVACYYLAEGGITLAYTFLQPHAAYSDLLSGAITAQTGCLPMFFAIVIYWGSTDFIEWGQAAVGGIERVVIRQLRNPTLFFLLVAGIAAAFMADQIRVEVLPLLPSVVTSIVTLALLMPLAHYARVDKEWPAQVPIGALLVGVAFLLIFFQIATAVVSFFTPRLLPEQLNPLYTIISVATAIALLLGALLVIARGRVSDSAELRAAGLFLAMMGLLFVALSVPQLANVFGLPVVPKSGLRAPALRLIILPATLLALGWLALRRRLTGALVAPFSVTLGMIVGLQVVYWFVELLDPALSAVSSFSVIVATLFFLAALLWDFVMSGNSVTNPSSSRFPSRARVLLYLGYTLLSMGTLVYLKSLRYQATGHIVPLGNESQMFQRFGAIGLGLPLIAYAFLQGMARNRSGRAPTAIGEGHGRSGRPAGSSGRRSLPGTSRGAHKIRIWRVNTTFLLGSASILLLALVTLTSCSGLGDGGQGQANSDATPTGTTASVATHPATHPATPRPTATPTIAVIDSGTTQAWSNPHFNQPTATSVRAKSASNGVGTYSIPVNVTFVPTPFQNDARFKPPVISLVFEYIDPSTNKDVREPLVSNQTKTLTLTETCPADGGATALDAAAAVYLQDGNGVVWKDLNATTPQLARNTLLQHIDLTC